MAIKCPKGQSENPETKQFCADCRTPAGGRDESVDRVERMLAKMAVPKTISEANELAICDQALA